MNSRIREAICLKTQPVAVIQTDHLPPDAQGWETEHHGCILPRLEDAADRGVSSAHECLSGQQSWAGV